MSIKALSDYTVYAKYAKYLPEKQRRETWKEQIDRVFEMHYDKYSQYIESNSKLQEYFEFAKEAVYKRTVLGAQRTLQFGGKAIQRHNEKLYNCSVTYIDRPRVFQEIMFLLLCGCGVGFSVQNKHTKTIPNIKSRDKGEKTFTIPDSIEGWADAIGIAVNSFFDTEDGLWDEYKGYKIVFDYSKIRPEGAPISGGFKAPGPDGLHKSIDNIIKLITKRLAVGETRLHNIDLYDIIMHASDAVLSGGVRRSATICLFSPSDEEMAKAKTGSWYYENPQRGRSNNSALLVRDETTKEDFSKLMESVKEFGEPGFVWADSEDVIYNPCVEIGMMPILKTDEGIKTGVQFCNLTEINGKKCNTKEEFFEACKASAILGTIQAGYNEFRYLGEVTEEIVKKEALLGCSITGMMDNYDILFDPKIQREGAELIKEINREVSQMIGINVAARCTCVKPAGSTSCVLGTSSGIHPHHARRYFRRVQANKLEFPVNEFQKHNPLAVEKSVWSNNGTDLVITFLCEVPQGSITKNQMPALDLLNNVKNTQQNWVEYGTNVELCNEEFLRHNVSNTITVEPHEWDDIERFIYRNRRWFAGISLLPASGDKDYPQAPFCTVRTPTEIVREYSDGSVFASGVIVNALNAFDNNLWKACDHAINDWKGTTDEQTNWVRQAKQFAERYFNGDVRSMTYCLKDVHNWKTWCDLKREYKEIDWSSVQETEEFVLDINTTGAQACAGGKCELVF